MVHNINHFDYIEHLKVFLCNLLFISSNLKDKEVFKSFFGIATSAPNVILEPPKVNVPEANKVEIEEEVDEPEMEEDVMEYNSDIGSIKSMNSSFYNNNNYENKKDELDNEPFIVSQNRQNENVEALLIKICKILNFAKSGKFTEI